MAKAELRVKGFVIIDGKEIPWETLPEQERAARVKVMCERAGEALSRYCTNKPEAFARFKRVAEGR